MTAPAGIRALLEGLQRFGWKPVEEDGKPIALLRDDGAAITLEPGGQFELSGAPLETIHRHLRRGERRISTRCKRSATSSASACSAWASIRNGGATTSPWMPKGRYKIMRDYMPKVGELGLDMMLRTCTVQVNLDYGSEADMVKQVPRRLALQPIATALFANSPFTEGRPNGFLCYRSHIWTDTDPDRTGMLPFVFEHGFGFERYVDYLLDVPMYFVYRDGKYIDVSGKSFRDFLEGELPACRAKMPAITRLRRSPDHRVSRKCGSSAIWKCAAPTAAAGGGSARCRRSGSGCSTIPSPSTRPGIWSRTGPSRK